VAGSPGWVRLVLWGKNAGWKPALPGKNGLHPAEMGRRVLRPYMSLHSLHMSLLEGWLRLGVSIAHPIASG
jgi:hypothetical protein